MALTLILNGLPTAGNKEDQQSFTTLRSVAREACTSEIGPVAFASTRLSFQLNPRHDMVTSATFVAAVRAHVIEHEATVASLAATGVELKFGHALPNQWRARAVVW